MNPNTTSSKPGKVPLKHDQFMRRCLTFAPDCTRELIHLTLHGDPILSMLDLDDWRVEPSVLLSNELGELQCDLLISVGLLGGDATVPRVMILFEHKSTAESDVLFQISKYRSAISLHYQKSIVLTLVLYHGQQRGWKLSDITLPALEHIPQALHHCVGAWAMDFPYRFLDFGDEQIQRQTEQLNDQGVYDILVRIWNLTKADVGEMCVASLKLAHEKRVQMCWMVMQYIQPLFTHDEICETEAEYLPKEKRIMTQVLSMEEETFQLGIEQGVANATQAIAENMLRGGFDVSKIVELTELSTDTVAELQHKLNGAGA